MPIKEPPTAAVMRSLQQLEGLLPLLAENPAPPSIAAIARRIAGLAATIANKTTTAEFAREVIMVDSGGCTPWLPGENTPQAAKNFVDQLTGMNQQPFYFEGVYAGTLYANPEQVTAPSFATIHMQPLIAQLIMEDVIQLERKKTE